MQLLAGVHKTCILSPQSKSNKINSTCYFLGAWDLRQHVEEKRPQSYVRMTAKKTVLHFAVDG